tara:strand:- start:104 stop:1453 length:1350 start_codon:yes stop_codon:yes gene_type:complete
MTKFNFGELYDDSVKDGVIKLLKMEFKKEALPPGAVYSSSKPPPEGVRELQTEGGTSYWIPGQKDTKKSPQEQTEQLIQSLKEHPNYSKEKGGFDYNKEAAEVKAIDRDLDGKVIVNTLKDILAGKHPVRSFILNARDQNYHGNTEKIVNARKVMVEYLDLEYGIKIPERFAGEDFNKAPRPVFPASVQKLPWEMPQRQFEVTAKKGKVVNPYDHSRQSQKQLDAIEDYRKSKRAYRYKMDPLFPSLPGTTFLGMAEASGASTEDILHVYSKEYNNGATSEDRARGHKKYLEDAIYEGKSVPNKLLQDVGISFTDKLMLRVEGKVSYLSNFKNKFLSLSQNDVVNDFDPLMNTLPLKKLKLPQSVSKTTVLNDWLKNDPLVQTKHIVKDSCGCENCFQEKSAFMGIIEKDMENPFAVATAQAKKQGLKDFSEGSAGAKKRDEIAEAIKE